MESAAWQAWLDRSLDRLGRLLASKLPEGHAGASAEELQKARKLVKWVARVIDHGDAAAWRRLALAYDVVAVGGALDDRGRVDGEPVDGEPTGGSPIDSTLPAVQFHPGPAPAASGDAAQSVPRHPPEHRKPPSTPVPPSHSVDETIAMGELPVLDIDDADAAAYAPAGSTLMTGEAPPAGHQRTVPIPVYMPPGVTANGVASGAPSSESGGTRPMQTVPSSVLDIEKYAVLCAWTEVHPERRKQLHAQYGLRDEAERVQLDAQFEILFKENRPFRSAFDRRLKMHLGFIQRTKG